MQSSFYLLAFPGRLFLGENWVTVSMAFRAAETQRLCHEVYGRVVPATLTPTLLHSEVGVFNDGVDRDMPVYGDRWVESSLERAGRKGEEVYLRALSRPVTWSPVKQKFCPQEEDCGGATLDEAFASMMKFLHKASRECRKYHCHHGCLKDKEDSAQHCERFHKVPQPIYNMCKGNLFEREETVRLTLPQGSYSVTAHKTGKHGTTSRRTNIVHVNDTGVLTLDFTV